MSSNPPGSETIDRLSDAVYPSFAMLAGMRLDVFTPLDKTPMSVDSLAEALRVGASKLSPLMYALAAAGLLTVRDGVFANTGESSYYLVKGKPNYVGSRHQLLSDLWGATLQAAETVRTGVPQARHDFSTMSRDDLEAFLAGLHADSMRTGRALARAYGFCSLESVVDVGGGSGGIAIAIAKECPGIVATVVELAEVASVTQMFIDREGTADRVKVQASSIVDDPPSGTFDAAVVKSLLQVLDPSEAERAVANVGDVVRPGGRIFVLGSILHDSRLMPTGTAAFNLALSSLYDGGQAYTQKEYTQWMESAGFVGVVRNTLSDGSEVLVARKTS